MRRIKTILASLALLAGISFNLAPVAALPINVMGDLKGDACAGLTQVDSSQGCGSKSDPVKSITSTVVSILSVVVGAVAIIMVIVSGFRYITSGGDSNKVSSAKSALIYALVGVVIAALAQLLVHFVLNNASSVVGK